jgi:hypothetical protein
VSTIPSIDDIEMTRRCWDKAVQNVMVAPGVSKTQSLINTFIAQFSDEVRQEVMLAYLKQPHVMTELMDLVERVIGVAEEAGDRSTARRYRSLRDIAMGPEATQVAQVAVAGAAGQSGGGPRWATPTTLKKVRRAGDLEGSRKAARVQANLGEGEL